MPRNNMPTALPHPLAGWDIISMRLFDTDHTIGNLARIAGENDWNDLHNIINLYTTDRFAIVVTDSQQRIKYVNDHFVTMTEYSSPELMNKKPSFLQRNDDLNKVTNELISEAVKAGREVKGHVVNYRKSGSLYHCNLHIIPVKDRQQRIVNYLAFEKEVA